MGSPENFKAKSTRRSWNNVPDIYVDCFKTGAFNVLPEEQRKILTLRFEEPRLNYGQVAECMGTSLSRTVFISGKAIEQLVLLEERGYPYDPEDFLIGGSEEIQK